MGRALSRYERPGSARSGRPQCGLENTDLKTYDEDIICHMRFRLTLALWLKFGTDPPRRYRYYEHLAGEQSGGDDPLWSRLCKN